MKKPVKQVKQTRRVFTAEFKAEAVRRMTDRRGQGVSLQQIGRELDVSADMLRAWAHQLKAGAEGPHHPGHLSSRGIRFHAALTRAT